MKKIAITEIKHAEEIAERLSYLGEKPTTKPSPIYVGENLKEMIERDVEDELKATNLYKEIIRGAREEGDAVTERIFRKILEDEEEHHDFSTSLLEDL